MSGVRLSASAMAASTPWGPKCAWTRSGCNDSSTCRSRWAYRARFHAMRLRRSSGWRPIQAAARRTARGPRRQLHCADALTELLGEGNGIDTARDYDDVVSSLQQRTHVIDDERLGKPGKAAGDDDHAPSAWWRPGPLIAVVSHYVRPWPMTSEVQAMRHSAADRARARGNPGESSGLN